MRRHTLYLLAVPATAAALLAVRGLAVRPAAAAPAAPHELKLWDTPAPRAGVKGMAALAGKLRVIPGNEREALEYYQAIRPSLGRDFPKAALTDSTIDDMLAYCGFPALPPARLEALDPEIIMDFEKLRRAISTPEFEAAYRDRPLTPGEVVVARFFAPKIVNVSDAQALESGAPKGGFGWRKVLRFRAREGSAARAAGLDLFYLLFNFTSGAVPKFPAGIHAGQIQAILVPVYPTGGRHRDAYFLVYQALDAATPGKIGTFLLATFDLASAVPDGKYYVPRACAQCHGTEVDSQQGAKVNYLDTDHWIDRTGDDFKRVKEADVLVDGGKTYGAIRQLNGEIERQNAAVLTTSASPFALLAVRKWLDLHAAGKPDADSHVPPLRRGLVNKPGDRVWTAGNPGDEQLLPLLNQYCFRCHSSVRYHVFQKQAVFEKKGSIAARVNSGNMPQDRDFKNDPRYKEVKEKIVQLVRDLQ